MSKAEQIMQGALRMEEICLALAASKGQKYANTVSCGSRLLHMCLSLQIPDAMLEDLALLMSNTLDNPTRAELKELSRDTKLIVEQLDNIVKQVKQEAE